MFYNSIGDLAKHLFIVDYNSERDLDFWLYQKRVDVISW